MGRLKGRGLPSRLRPQRSRLPKPEPTNTGGEDRPPWHKWYYLARWQRLRKAVLRRDRYTCQATGVPLIDGRKDPCAAVIDHIVPHRGDPALFWDETNLRAVCKAWHDSEKQRMENRGDV